MQTIKDLINQIKWDKNLDPGEYSLFYLDRITNELKEIRFKDIKRIEEETIIIEKWSEEKSGEETGIPMHRIKRVKKKEKTVWMRK